MLAKARARSSPPSLLAATSAALVSRWSALLTGSYFLCSQFAVRRPFSPPQPGRRPSTARPPPFAHEPPLCLSVASQPGSGRSGLTPSLPQAHLETGQYKNSLCLEAAQYNSPLSMHLLQLKRSGGKKNQHVFAHFVASSDRILDRQSDRRCFQFLTLRIFSCFFGLVDNNFYW